MFSKRNITIICMVLAWLSSEQPAEKVAIVCRHRQWFNRRRRRRRRAPQAPVHCASSRPSRLPIQAAGQSSHAALGSDGQLRRAFPSIRVSVPCRGTGNQRVQPNDSTTLHPHRNRTGRHRTSSAHCHRDRSAAAAAATAAAAEADA